MYILPQSVHSWTALFGGISYSAWAFIVCSRLVGLPEPQEREKTRNDSTLFCVHIKQLKIKDYG